MNKRGITMARLVLPALLIAGAGVLVAGCHGGSASPNVVGQAPLPIYHAAPGAMNPKQARAYWTAKRRRVP